MRNSLNASCIISLIQLFSNTIDLCAEDVAHYDLFPLPISATQKLNDRINALEEISMIDTEKFSTIGHSIYVFGESAYSSITLLTEYERDDRGFQKAIRDLIEYRKINESNKDSVESERFSFEITANTSRWISIAMWYLSLRTNTGMFLDALPHREPFVFVSVMGYGGATYAPPLNSPLGKLLSSINDLTRANRPPDSIDDDARKTIEMDLHGMVESLKPDGGSWVIRIMDPTDTGPTVEPAIERFNLNAFLQ